MYVQLSTSISSQWTQIHISAYVKNSVSAFILKKHKGVYAPVILTHKQKGLCYIIIRR